MKRSSATVLLSLLILIAGCKKSSTPAITTKDATAFFTVDGVYNGTLTYKATAILPKIKLNFSEPLNPASITNITWKTSAGVAVNFSYVFSDANKVVEITPTTDLTSFTTYQLVIPGTLTTASGGKVINPFTISLQTGFDGKNKFPTISDDDLLTLVQRQTFKYFWDFAHPNSGLARERNTSGDLVTSGGSGFGIMAIPVAINRSFITRADGLARMQKIVYFLKNTAQRFHGAYSHWLNGNTGVVYPFGTNDDGADIVETSYLMMGLLTARQYFDQNTSAEINLRNDINAIYQAVEWDWFRQNGKQALYWNWSPNAGWAVNVAVQGWNETLITYVMAAASPTYTIPKSVYDYGFTRNGAMVNGNSYYGIQLPLGSAYGGPLFFAHYSFMGINPIGLSDNYANYEVQNRAHTLINYKYCIANPKNYTGYSQDCWGLTASDIPNGYAASSPNNDLGVIAPTAAISSMPYTPTESMQALRFFYYKLGDKLWGDYGFYDAFRLNDAWFASSTLAIDQGPIIVMIENHRTGLLWNLFMSCPEVKAGLTKLGFQSPKI